MRNTEALVVPADLLAAIGLLTRLPVRLSNAAISRGAAAAWAWPVVGIVVALISGLAAHLTIQLGLPYGIAALILLAVQIIVTGAMHEDGLADSLDGMWGGWTIKRRLAIMKDSQIGTYGVLGLSLSLLCRWQLWIILLDTPVWPAVIAVGVISRWTMVVIAWALPHARSDGLGHSVGRPRRDTVFLASGLTATVTVLMLGWIGVCTLATISLVTIAWGLIARAKIKGQTGDILGAGQHIAEVTGLLTIATFIG